MTKYSLAFALLGALTSYCAVSLGGLWYFLFWLAISFFTLSVAYAGVGAKIFFKQQDGRMPLWVKVTHLPFLLYSSGVWNVVKAFSSENPYDNVREDLILGRRLRFYELPRDVVNYVDLTAEFEDPKEIVDSTNYICLPILDASVPLPGELMDAISRLRAGTTYIHCAQGHGRTGLFALALLSRQGSVVSFEEGLSLLKRIRPGIGLNKAQEAFVRRLMSEQHAPS